jgi:hypothetical protein
MFRWLNLSARGSPGALRFGVFDSADSEAAANAQAAVHAQAAADAQPAAHAPARGPTGHESVAPAKSGGGLASRLVFEGPTAFLTRFHCHVSKLAAGGGYQPHADPYDVGIVLLEGEVETLGRRVEPRAVIAYQAGAAHGMRNVGDTAATYLVFEFQGTPTPYWIQARQAFQRAPRRALRKAGRMLLPDRPGR